MKKFLATIIFFSIYINPSFSDSHKTKFKDIKGFKKQFISMSEKKVNRIKEVKKSDGFPVYEGETSIQFTVNREDAGCGKGKAQTTQIQCDGKGNRSRQELHLGDMKLKNKEYIYEYAVYFDESYEPLKKALWLLLVKCIQTIKPKVVIVVVTSGSKILNIKENTIIAGLARQHIHQSQ